MKTTTTHNGLNVKATIKAGGTSLSITTAAPRR